MGASSSFSDGEEGGAVSDINVTPLVDVVLVLLIVFMVTMPAIVGTKSIKVDLPESGTSGSDLSQVDTMPIQIAIRREPSGEVVVYLGDRSVKIDEIGAFVDSLGPTRTAHTVRLGADKGIPYGNIVRVMDELRKHGMEKLALDTKPIEQ
jgi:biopolymer transport protein ExbD